METPTHPSFVLYVVWHPDYAPGASVAERLHHHFGANRYRNIVGGAGVAVLFRSAAGPGSAVPLPIDWDNAETTAAVVLIDNALVNDSAWEQYVCELVEKAAMKGLRSRVFPVAMEEGVLEIGLGEQALRWDRWTGEDSEREQRLLRDLTYEFSRMLRHHLAQLRHPDEDEEQLSRYLRKVQVFLSHSKHDDHGQSVAEGIRDWLDSNSALSSFLDVRDIPAGLSSREVLLNQIKNSVVLALHTDSYSSREWCRREVIEAKRHHVPMIVVDCLRDLDERSIPYMGNVPIIRMSPDGKDRIGAVIGCLLDEVFKDFLWHCRVERFRATHPNVLFMARPPELISLATLPIHQSKVGSLIVYPEPPMGTDETRLFSEIAPDVCTQTMMQWLEDTQ